MIILGIDPGTATTGWGTIEVIQKKRTVNPERNNHGEVNCLSYGCIKTPVEMIMPERLLMLRQELIKLLVRYKPDFLVIEQLFFGVNAKTAMSVGQARGVILVTATEAKIKIHEYQGLQVKFILTGYGRSDKKVIQKRVQEYLKLKDKIKSDDAADALGVAICHFIKSNQPKVKPKNGK